MAEIVDDLTARIATLRVRAGEFSDVYNNFLSVRGWTVYNPTLSAEWDRAYSYATAVKNTVSWINNQVDTAANWFSKIFGLSGVSGMAALPAISAAYIVSATAALVFAVDWMVKIIKEAEIEAQKVQLVNEGKASENILYPDSGIFAGATGSLVKWAIIGAAAYFLLPKLLEKMDR